MKKLLSISLLCGLLLTGCGSNTAKKSSSSELPPLAPPERQEFSQPLPETASYTRYVRRFKNNQFESKTAETFDDHDNIIRTADVNVTTNSETPTRQYSYTYNEDGTVAEVCDYGYVSTRTVYTYNEDGKPLTIEVFDVDSGALKSTDSCTYNEHGDLTKQTRITGGKETFISAYKYEYDDNGTMTVRYELWSDDTEKSKEEFTYNGDRISDTVKYIYGSNELYCSKFHYEYDPEGRELLTEQTDMTDENTVKETYATVNTYDSTGRLIKREKKINGIVSVYELYDYQQG
ncbi:MAG: hypothetical protein IKS13_08915 [Ruminococcus sp.]|nr:hypothetical protein [Ruminococcus sp.]